MLMASIIFFCAVVVACLYLKNKFPIISGLIGERYVGRKLRRLDPAHYKVFANVLLPSNGNTKTTQIDHLVISNYGIFCIETKSHSGWIYGTASNEYWTQVFYYKKYRLYNPLRQNYAHAKALEHVLVGHIKSPIISLVAFPCADRLIIHGTDMVANGHATVEKLSSYQQPIYSQQELDTIAAIISAANITDKSAFKQHVRDVRSLVAR